MHWHGPGSKFGHNEKLNKFKEEKNQIITDNQAYFVSDIHLILLLETPF